MTGLVFFPKELSFDVGMLGYLVTSYQIVGKLNSDIFNSSFMTSRCPCISGASKEVGWLRGDICFSLKKNIAS